MNFSSDQLQQEIEHLQRAFEAAPPNEILQWAADTYGDSLAIVTSFQPTGIVTLHMLQTIAPQTPVITLDTGFLFPETYTLIDHLTSHFSLNLHWVRPELSPTQQATRYGPDLWHTQPDQCCALRKVIPLHNALAGFSAWIAGLRRDQSPSRAKTPAVGWDTRNNMIKICPFINWTESMIWAYIQAHNLPYNPLHDAGYPSIGCTYCTQAVHNGDDLRSGRWANHAKTECGIHTPLNPPHSK